MKKKNILLLALLSPLALFGCDQTRTSSSTPADTGESTPVETGETTPGSSTTSKETTTPRSIG